MRKDRPEYSGTEAQRARIANELLPPGTGEPDQVVVLSRTPVVAHSVMLTVNGEPRTLPGPLTVAELLERLGIDRRRVAVEVNREVVPAPTHGSRALAPGARVEKGARLVLIEFDPGKVNSQE